MQDIRVDNPCQLRDVHVCYLFLLNRILFTQSNKNLIELFENLNALNSYKASPFLLFTKHPKQSEHKQIIPDTGHVLITWLVIRLIYTTRWRFGLVRKVLQSVHWILFYFKGKLNWYNNIQINHIDIGVNVI